MRFLVKLIKSQINIYNLFVIYILKFDILVDFMIKSTNYLN